MPAVMHCHVCVITAVDFSLFVIPFICTAQSLQLFGRYESYLYAHQVPFPHVTNISPAKSAKPRIST